jgi:hypothetical protein
LNISPNALNQQRYLRCIENGAGRDALQAWMAQDGDGAARNHGDGLHVRGEGVDLHAVDLVASEGARGLLSSGLF